MLGHIESVGNSAVPLTLYFLLVGFDLWRMNITHQPLVHGLYDVTLQPIPFRYRKVRC